MIELVDIKIFFKEAPRGIGNDFGNGLGFEWGAESVELGDGNRMFDGFEFGLEGFDEVRIIVPGDDFGSGEEFGSGSGDGAKAGKGIKEDIGGFGFG